MNTKEIKEVIEFLENTIYLAERDDLSLSPHKAKYNCWIKEAIRLLKQSKKYKKMWEEFKKENRLLWIQIKVKYNPHITLGRLMDDFEKKYFPQEKVIK